MKVGALRAGDGSERDLSWLGAGGPAVLWGDGTTLLFSEILNGECDTFV